jgi:hypothetical protein
MYNIAIKFHQEFYNLSDNCNEYQLTQQNHLKNYITFGLYGLFGLLGYESQNEIPDINNLYANCHNKKVVDLIYKNITKLFDNNLNHAVVRCTILYNFTYNSKLLQNCDDDKLEKLISLHPILKFRLMDSANRYHSNTWYVDDQARFYKSWNDYKNTNLLPPCTMLLPKDGIYQANLKELWSSEESIVSLETYVKIQDNLKNTLDTVSKFVSAGTFITSVCSIFMPITFPITTVGKLF